MTTSRHSPMQRIRVQSTIGTIPRLRGRYTKMLARSWTIHMLQRNPVEHH